MDLSMKWINDYVDLKNIDIKQFCHEMTMSGSKVEGYETRLLYTSPSPRDS